MNHQYFEAIENHYISCWRSLPIKLRWGMGPVNDLPKDFSVLCFKPNESRNMWAYATCGMSQATGPVPVELHLFAPNENDSLVELLTVIVHYHRTESFLDLGHTVNFGRPWWPGSACDRGLISLPYLDGPSLEWLEIDDKNVRFLWLIPITVRELDYKKQHGLEALEEKFEDASFNYMDPKRSSII